MKSIKNLVLKVLYRPYIAFLFCLGFLFLNLVIDGTVFRIFKLNQSLKVLQNRTSELEKKQAEIERKIKKASDPAFIEEEARKRLDYTSEGDLIFIFPDKL